MRIYIASDDQEIEEDNANISRVDAGRYVPFTFCTLVISYASDPEVIKLFPFSTQLSMKFSRSYKFLTFMSRKKSILDFSEPKKY